MRFGKSHEPYDAQLPLRHFPSLLEAHYAIIPEAYRHWAPPSWEGVPSEAFTAIEQLCHVRDIEIEGYHVRFRRTLEEDNPTLASIDSEPLAIARAYGMADAAQVLAEFRIARAQTMEIISQLSDAQLARTSRVRGLRTAHDAQPHSLPLQPRPAASCGPAMAARQDRRIDGRLR